MRYPFLSEVKLPRGALDLRRDVPGEEIRMMATTANLVARKNLHPALVDLVLAAAKKVHGGRGIFEERSQFPSPDYLDLPLNEEAERYLTHGPSLLNRFLPFWAATFIDRFKVMLVPFLLLFVPLFKILPPLFIWRIRSRIYRWYGELVHVEQDLRARGEEGQGAALAKLDGIDASLRELHVPAAFNRDFYILREHVEMLRGQIERRTH